MGYGMVEIKTNEPLNIKGTRISFCKHGSDSFALKVGLIYERLPE